MKTMRTGDTNLKASCFAYVPDVEDPRTWRVALRVPGDTVKTINFIKNAISRFPETKGIPDHALSTVWNVIVGAAKGYGIGVDPRQPKRTVTAEPAPEILAAHKQEQSEALADLAAERHRDLMQAQIEEVESELWMQHTREKLAELTR